ncbi:MAG TPA: hypothetical protein VLF59_02895 [Candidatus Saccharimonadales bacterium]|nr:hypothetical protein [Candidatus Saccharimonadales bacterium]
MYAAELAQPPRMVSFLNKHATHGETADESAHSVRETFAVPHSEDTYYPLTTRPKAHQIAEFSIDDDQLLVYSHGGDGTVNLAVAAITGNVRNDLKRTEQNKNRHTKYAHKILYVPGAGGNANNFALSALKGYAAHPDRLARGKRFWIGYHHPLEYQIRDKDGQVTASGIATSCFGAGASATVAHELEQAKPELVQLDKHIRTRRERRLVAQELYNAQPYKAIVTVGNERSDISRYYPEVNGIELIGSKIYAKQGRSGVNIDSPKFELFIARHIALKAARLGNLAILGTQLATGMLPGKPVDFSTTSVSIQNVGEHTMPLHTDGETGTELSLPPEHIVRLTMGQIAVPVLMYA